MLVVSSAPYIAPQICGFEAADQVDALSQFGAGWVPGALTAANTHAGTVNPLAWPILIASLLAIAGIGAYLFWQFMSRPGQEESVQPRETAAWREARSTRQPAPSRPRGGRE